MFHWQTRFGAQSFSLSTTEWYVYFHHYPVSWPLPKCYMNHFIHELGVEPHLHELWKVCCMPGNRCSHERSALRQAVLGFRDDPFMPSVWRKEACSFQLS